MTYAIGSFIFGLNLKNLSVASEQIQEDIADLVDADLVQTEYSGNGDEPTYIGAAVAGIDEASEMSWAEIIDLKDTLKAAMAEGSDAQKEFQALLNAVLADTDTSDETKDWLKAQTPEVFLTWGSS